MEGPQLFAFRWKLYGISKNLTGSDIGKMKFMLSDFLPRQQLETTKSGFDLLCLMATRKDILSPDNYSFLEEVMQEVGKSDYVRSQSSAPNLSDAWLMSSPCTVIPQQQKPKVLEVKKLLGEICDNLSVENIHDLCLFFAGICGSINYNNLHTIKSAEDLFCRLQESHLLGIGQLQPLQQVLGLIGRVDLASSIEAFKNGTWQSVSTSQRQQVFASHSNQPEQIPSFSTPEMPDVPSIPTPEEQKDHEGIRVFAGHSLSSSGISQTDSLPELETDSGCNTQQLLFKIKDRERKLETQEAELILLRKQLLCKEHQDQQKLLEDALEKKNAEVQSLHGSLVMLQELLWKKNDVPLYIMNRKPHGLAIVIINQHFQCSISSNVTLKYRMGASKDRECFSHVFSFLHYNVKIHQNLSATEMESLMVSLGALKHDEFDSFICCVSSHGNQHGIYGSDSILLDRNTFIDPIKSCTSLVGKPKMFFFQACRVPMVSADSPEKGRPSLSTMLHCDSDILIANASTEGNPAYTSPETGSWFANALRRKLTDPQLVYVRTLQQVLEEVTDLVSQATGVLPSGETVNQCVEVVTRMRKGVKFLNEN